MLVDLSIPIREGLPVAPNHPPFEWEPLSYETAAHTVRFRSMTTSNHVGTHVDAPAHFVEGGATIDELDLGLFDGPATVVDLRARDDRAITRSALEARVDGLHEDGRVILVTGDVDALFADGDFFGEAAYPTEGAAEWLLEQGASVVALDCLGDDVEDEADPVHETLLGAGVPIVDYLCNTAPIADRREVWLSCFPLSIPGFDAAPARAVARVDG